MVSLSVSLKNTESESYTNYLVYSSVPPTAGYMKYKQMYGK